TKNSLTQFVLFLTQGELIEDPKDFLANFFLKSAEQLSISSQHFAALYLLSHGLIKIFLVVGLFRKKLWAYPISIAVFGVFIIYQMYRFTVTGSLWLIIFTIFDLVVVILTIHEYTYMKNNAVEKS